MNRTTDIVELSATDLDRVSGAGMDGITRLINVTQMKASNANDEALGRKAGEGQKDFLKVTLKEAWIS